MVRMGIFLLPFPSAPHRYPYGAETPELLAPCARSVLDFFPSAEHLPLLEMVKPLLPSHRV